MEKRFEAFERMFNPRSIAVVGVSAEGFGFGRGILLSLVSMGYTGELYPVNPSGGTISGRKLYPSIEAIPEPIDFAIIAVPAEKFRMRLNPAGKRAQLQQRFSLPVSLKLVRQKELIWIGRFSRLLQKASG